MSSRGLKLLAYGRVSDVRGRSGESFISPEDQMSKCRSYAETYEHTILEERLDLDVSGGTMSRPELDRFLERIRSGKAQGLIVAKLDRFARSSRGALNTLAEIEDAGGVLISVQEQIDSTTAAGRFVRAIFLATAEWERERIGESWVTAKKDAVRRGIHVSRHVPPGYVRDKGGKLKPHPKHGKTITKAYQLAASGSAPADVARYLTERGLPSGDNQNPVWRSSRIKRLLANRVYLGEARANGEIRNPNAHPPLTDEATFLRAQRKPTTPLVKSTALLSGLVRCAECRHSMKHQGASAYSTRTYRCANTDACPQPSAITAARLEEIVVDAYLDRVFSRQVETVEQDDTQALAAVEDAKRAVAEVEALRSELRPAAYAQALDSALGELETAEAELAKLQPRSHDISDLLPQIEAQQGLDMLGPEGTALLRSALSKEIQAAFVRPPARRSKNLPISDRVKIVWADEETLELPTRGESKELPPFTWNGG